MSALFLVMDSSSFDFGPWRLTVTKSRILRSKCEKGLDQGCPIDSDSKEKCNVCRFEKELSIPSLPEMVFPESSLRLEHESGAVLEFLSLEALKLVNSAELPPTLKVATADQWSRQRAEGLLKVKEIAKPFDWTYTTDYKGTISSIGEKTFEVVETDERIDYQKLKMQERISFYDEVILFEDELADNGAAIFSVKVRVMPSGFYVLSRFFLRVDGVMVRLNDTRFYHQAGSDHILREYSSKDAKVEELKVPTSVLTEPNKLSDLLPTRLSQLHKLHLPT